MHNKSPQKHIADRFIVLLCLMRVFFLFMHKLKTKQQEGCV